jgi:triosephosphate isomerase
MRKYLVAGNWKMNGTRRVTAQLIESLKGNVPDSVEVLVFPPSVYLDRVYADLEGSLIKLGGQNIDWREEGAVTGETSASMLKDIGCTYCLVGHSERRALFAETDEQVANKFKACIASGLSPVLCVGESLEQRKTGQTMEVVARQIQAVTDSVGIADIGGGVIAYEPVWAIGTGESATPEQAEEVHSAIRDLLRQEDAATAEDMRILYGGSVKQDNAAGLFEKDNIDGALVGGASLVGADFKSICQAAANRMEE